MTTDPAGRKRFTTAEVVAILAAIVTLVTAFGVSTVNIIVALRTTAVVEQSLDATQKVGAQVEQVHVLTNSNMAALKAELSNALTEITALRAMVSELRGQRDVAAAPSRGTTRTPAPLPVIIENQPGEEVPVTVKPER